MYSTTSIPKLQLKVTKDKCVSATVTSQRCDRGVQCSKSTEYLKVAPEVKFFSRSSLVIKEDKPLPTLQRRNRARRVSSPSLEYVACYKSEMLKTSSRVGDGGTVSGLRSFSSSAIFGLESGAGRTSYDGPAERCYVRIVYAQLNLHEEGKQNRKHFSGIQSKIIIYVFYKVHLLHHKPQLINVRHAIQCISTDIRKNNGKKKKINSLTLIKNNVKFSVFVFLHTNNLLYKYKYYNNYLFIIHSLYTAQGTSTRTDRVVPRASPRSAVFGRRSGARRTRFFATRTSSSPIWPASTTRRLSPSSRNRARTASTATMCSP